LNILDSYQGAHITFHAIVIYKKSKENP